MASGKNIVPFQEVLVALVSWFKNSSTKAMIIGGVAQSILARPRLTQDIDALILVDDKDLARFFKEGSRFGFVPRLSDALDFAKKNRVLLMRHAASRIDVDISLAALPFEEESFKRLKLVKVGKISIPLPTPEDLIIMKAVAHRPKDILDIQAMIESVEKIDFNRVKKWVREFSEALDAPDIYADLIALINRLKRS